MRKGVVSALAIAMTMPAILSARSDDIPTLDVNPVCHGITVQGGLEAGLQQTSFQQCVQSEQEVREQLKKQWSTFSAADKQHCVSLAKTGGESSYTELLTCLEMARDVRQLHSQTDKLSGPVPEGRPAPVGHRQPTSQSSRSQSSLYLSTRSPSSPSSSPPAPSSSSPSSPRTSMVQPAPAPSESSKSQSDSIVKELQQAKVDAINARASESIAQRKLTNTEADLKQAKDEAAQAIKEAEQAKMDAQKARESRAQAENKLAAAQAAQVAAEESEKACQNAAKTQPGFGERLRSWFGGKPSNP
jgi:hypothetical protein